MVRRFSYIFALCAIIMLQGFSPGTVDAASTIDCHCFRDRSFSSENPTAFDPYLLATVQNRLMAYTFGLSRKAIVKEKMSGASGDQLWVLYWIARASGDRKQFVEEQYIKDKSWRSVLRAVSADTKKLGQHFMAAVPEENTEKLAMAAVDQVFETFFSASRKDQIALRAAGATLKEVIISNLLALLQNDNALNVFRKARQKGSWGSVSVAVGTTVEEIDAFLARRYSLLVK